MRRPVPLGFPVQVVIVCPNPGLLQAILPPQLTHMLALALLPLGFLMQVVVFCPNPGLLAAIVLSLVPLLRPYEWHYPLIPVTPLSMMGFLDAPVPFVMGVQYKSAEIAARCVAYVFLGLLCLHVWRWLRCHSQGAWGVDLTAPLSAAALPHLPKPPPNTPPHPSPNMPPVTPFPLLHLPRSCHGLTRVNVYKDAVKATAFPQLPNARALAAALAAPHTALCAAGPAASERPVHMLLLEEAEAARSFAATVHTYLAGLVGDIRLHTITNVGMSQRTGWLMTESLVDGHPQRDRSFVRAFTETQMFAVFRWGSRGCGGWAWWAVWLYLGALSWFGCGLRACTQLGGRRGGWF